MSGPLTIALDAMGGDNAPDVVLRGANIARRRYPEVRFLLFGERAELEKRLGRLKGLAEACVVAHAPTAIANDMKPTLALRQGRESSMWLAIDAVRSGRAAGVVSAGNTGALMAMAKMSLKTLAGIHRPAIAGLFPTRRGETVVLDLGANLDCAADDLVQFGVMGAVFARIVLGTPEPTVGLLNVGSEEGKGHDEVRQAASILRAKHGTMRFAGFVEGNDIAEGTVDVVVTDGFTGNVALKTAEGTAKLATRFLRNAFRSSLAARLGYLLARNALAKMRARVDPRRHNGAMLVGLNGIVIKSHGGTDAFGFANAIGVAVDMAANGCNERIIEGLAFLGASAPAADVQVAVS